MYISQHLTAQLLEHILASYILCTVKVLKVQLKKLFGLFINFPYDDVQLVFSSILILFLSLLIHSVDVSLCQM